MDLKNQIFNLFSYIENENYEGYDPYDGLNSKLLIVFPYLPKYFKIAWIQFFKIFPYNLRKFFLIPKGLNPKGLGLILSSYVNIYKETNDEIWIIKAKKIERKLLELRSKSFSNYCWGYNFDWQSRAFFVPSDTPTIVNTSFIGHALLDLYEVTLDKRLLDIVDSSCIFITRDLNRYEDDNNLCFSYTPIDHTKVHNASILGAGLLARFEKLNNSNLYSDIITKCFNYLDSHQQKNGSWFYAETNFQSWVDSFHTAFNLFSLQHIYKHIKNKNIYKTIQKGETYYLNSFFTDSGQPKYYSNKMYPLDIHSSSMALAYISEYCKNKDKLIEAIFTWQAKNLLSKDGYFFFRINKYLKNKISYMRWSQAWALYGLTKYCFMKKDEKNEI
jgi:hypothetical protein